MVSGPEDALGTGQFALLKLAQTWHPMSQALRKLIHLVQGNTLSLGEALCVLGLWYGNSSSDPALCSTSEELQQLLDDVRARIWCTYRRDFQPLGGAGLTSDVGWGCTLRTGQMLLAEAIQRKTIGRHRQHGDTVQDALQVQIVNLVLDTPVSSSLEPVAHAALSLHSLCAAGQALGVVPGRWLGPYTLCRSIEHLLGGSVGEELGLHVVLVADPLGGGGAPTLWPEVAHRALAAAMQAPVPKRGLAAPSPGRPGHGADGPVSSRSLSKESSDQLGFSTYTPPASDVNRHLLPSRHTSSSGAASMSHQQKAAWCDVVPGGTDQGGQAEAVQVLHGNTSGPSSTHSTAAIDLLVKHDPITTIALGVPDSSAQGAVSSHAAPASAANVDCSMYSKGVLKEGDPVPAACSGQGEQPSTAAGSAPTTLHGASTARVSGNAHLSAALGCNSAHSGQAHTGGSASSMQQGSTVASAANPRLGEHVPACMAREEAGCVTHKQETAFEAAQSAPQPCRLGNHACRCDEGGQQQDTHSDSGCQEAVAGSGNGSAVEPASSSTGAFGHPALLVLVPLTLGLGKMNPVYIPQLQEVLTWPQSVGVVGGRPGASLYLAGYQGSNFLVLDPHDSQPCAQPGQVASFVCSTLASLPSSVLDPSLALGFVVMSAAELDDLLARLKALQARHSGCPLLTVAGEGASSSVPAHVREGYLHNDSGEGTSSLQGGGVGTGTDEWELV